MQPHRPATKPGAGRSWIVAVAGGVMYLPVVHYLVGADSGFLYPPGFEEGVGGTPASWIIAFGIGSGIAREMFTMRGGSLEDGSHLMVRLVLGRSDRLVPFSEAERLRDLLKTAGYDVTPDAFDGADVVPDDALKRAVTWLKDLANRR